MNRISIVGILGCAFLLCAPAGASEAAGRVVFGDGASPAAPRGVRAMDAVVWLVGAAPAPASPNARAVFDQKDLAFTPHVLPVREGTTVEFRNSDAVLHNIHTRSRLNPFFNRAQLGGGKFDVAFPKPEVIAVNCDVHSQMNAWIVVLPSPYFAKPGRNGTFSIRNVPPGRYRLFAWHERYATVEIGSVDVSGERATLPDVRFSGSPRPAGAR